MVAAMARAELFERSEMYVPRTAMNMRSMAVATRATRKPSGCTAPQIKPMSQTRSKAASRPRTRQRAPRILPVRISLLSSGVTVKLVQASLSRSIVIPVAAPPPTSNAVST